MNSITPTPWSVSETNGYLTLEGKGELIIPDWDINEDRSVGIFVDQERERANFKAIVSAVNCTYGNGISPEAVKDMWTALVLFTTWAEMEAKWDKTGQSYYAAKSALEKAKL